MKDLKLITIFPENSIKSAMNLINKNGFGSLIVINKKSIVLGTLTDGDIRRAIFKGKQINEPINKIFQKKIFKIQFDKFDLNILQKKCLEKNLNIIPILKNKKLVDFYSLRLKKNKKNNIQTVIMAGGLGTRMRPFTNIFPKPMLPINNKTMIEVVIEQFIKFNLKNFIFTINYKSDLLNPYLKDLSKQIKINYKIIKEKKRLGTAGSLKFFKNKIKSDFFVTNCDTILKANLNEIYEFHKTNKNDITIVAAIKNETIPYGVLKVTKQQNFSKIYEKPKNSYIVNTGVYVLNPKILKNIPLKDEIFDMNQLIYKCKEKQYKIKVYLIDGDLWHDVGQITNYQKFVEQENN